MILITGGTGFLGKHFVQKLLKESQHQITIISRSSVDSSFAQVKYIKPKRLEIRKFFLENPFSIIVHLATEYGRGNNFSSSEIVRQVNLDLPSLILEESFNGPPQLFINCDSFYLKNGSDRLTLRDYVDSKSEFRKMLSENFSHISSVTLQFEHIFGPGDSLEKFIPMVICKALSNSVALDLTGCEQIRDFLYVDDAASAIITTLDNHANLSKKVTVIEVGSGRSTSLKDLVNLVIAETQSKLTPNFGALPYISGELDFSVANLGALTDLGWKPKVELTEGLRKTIKYYKGLINPD